MDVTDELPASLDLVFHGLNVGTNNKQILKDVYGAVYSGQIMAIMGPSGAGKSTLLNTLSGRMAPMSGSLTLNDVSINKRLKRKICYVLQQDAFFPNLTLLETLTFTAMMRLPEKMSRVQKMNKLDRLIDELDLRKCVNTKMGGMWMPGLSGGEMKRASIACELITDPLVILLDEPTSGLDYKTAFSLITTLKKYASLHNKTVVMTIHQPSSQIFLKFNLLLLMCKGHSVYYGPPDEVTQFFSRAGHHMTPHYNPADFILEKLKEGPTVQKQIIKASYSTRQVDFTTSSSPDALDGDVDIEYRDVNKTQRKWNRLQRKQFGKNKKDDAHVSLMELDTEVLVTNDNEKWPTGFITQYKHLTLRTFKQSKSCLVDKFKIFESAFLCVLLSLIWFQLPRSEDTLRDRMGLIFYLSMHWGFTPLFDAVTTFPMEKGVINRERAAGWYRLSAYYLAKMTSELPLILIQPFIFLTIVYWVAGLNNVASFFATVGTVFIHSITGQSIGLCIGIFCMDMRRGISVSTVFIMGVMLLGGFYTRHLPFWLNWAKYLAFLHYTFHCLMFLEFYGAADFQCPQLTSTVQSQFTSCMAGSNTSTSVPTIPSEEVLQYYGIDLPFWQYFLPLFAFLIFFRVLGYLILRFYQKPK